MGKNNMKAGLWVILTVAAVGFACHKQKATQVELIWAGAIPDFEANVEQIQSVQPSKANYPNPFSPTGGTRYQIDKDSAFVSLIIYDIQGKPFDTLVNGWQPQGDYHVRWSLRGNYNSGVYFYQLKIGDSTETKKLALRGDEHEYWLNDSRFTIKIAKLTDTLAMIGEIFRTDTAYHPDAPNPFSPPGDIFFRYHIDSTQRVHLVVSDIAGAVVDTVMRIKQLPGYYRATLRPQAAKSGVYFYTLTIGDWNTTQKFIVLR